MQSIVVRVGDDDSALVGDAHSLGLVELTWLTAFGAEHEQERAIDRRQYLHSMIVGIGDDDSMSIIIDRNSDGGVERARLRSSLAADREQEREIDRRQEHQSMIFGVGDDDAMMMLVDRNASKAAALDISWSNARQERLVAQRP